MPTPFKRVDAAKVEDGRVGRLRELVLVLVIRLLQRLARANCLDVVGGLSEAEAQLLAWLVARGYQVGVMCSLLYTMDRRGHGHGHVYPLYSWDPCRNRATHRATLHPR